MPQRALPELLGHVLSRVCRLTHARMYALVGQIGLHRGQPLLLKALWGEDGRTHTELSERLHVRPATMTNMIKHMERAGFVERRPDERDRRVSRVYVTRAGREIQAEVEQVWRSFEVQVFRGLGDENQALLRRLLLQVEENLQELGDAPTSMPGHDGEPGSEGIRAGVDRDHPCTKV